MTIQYGSKGVVINDFNDWSSHYNSSPGHSAWEFGQFIMNNKGLDEIKRIIDAAIGKSVTFDDIRIEKSVAFDAYPRPSMRDMVIEGTTSEGKSVFLTIEAKVDETFGDYVKSKIVASQKYKKEHQNSKAEERLRGLFKRLLKTDQGMNTSELRYQLFHATAATAYVKYDYNIMLVIEIRPTPKALKNNQNNFMAFMKAIGAKGGNVNENTMEFNCPVKDKNNKDVDVKFLFVKI